MKVTLNAMTQPVLEPENNTVEQHRGLAKMSPEEYMIYCARVSVPDNRLNHETAPKLMKHLIDSGHWSPFEMISIAFEIETSRAIAQQLLRHRSFSFQEFSQRYSKVENIEPVELRYQAEKNRQSSTDVIHNLPVDKAIEDHFKFSQSLYNQLIKKGVAKECARMVLPLATQTTLIMHGTLRSWIHFFNQRCDEHAQKEAQEIAYAIREKLSEVCPWTAKALEWVS